MQKAINVIALLSGLVSLSTLISIGYLYQNKDVLIEEAREKVSEEVLKAVSQSLTGGIKEIPVIPFP